VRLHRGGRSRAWLGKRLGGDRTLGDRVLRRALHGAGAVLVLYYLLPPNVLGIPNPDVLLAALAVVLGIEAGRWAAGLELPTLRPVEAERPASFAYFAVALVIAVLFFPEAVAVAVILGAALVDPLIGELRRSERWRPAYPALPLAVYAVLAGLSLRWVGGASLPSTVLLAVLASVAGVGAEYPRLRYLDDDLTMVIVPGLVLTVLLAALPGVATIGA